MLTPRTIRPRLIILSALVLAAGPRPAAAQQVKWVSDYNVARKEASEKGRPILIDFGTENCFWCKKLDLSTFQDPAVVALLNEQFVALKVDADRESTLTQTLRIQQYPTLVLAGPEGKILGVLEGYQEASVLAEQLRKVANGYKTPDWMTRDFQEAAKAILASDYTRAVTLLKGVTQDGKDRSVQVKARQVLQDLEQQAAGRLARAKGLLDRGQSAEAAEVVTELLRSYAGTQAAADGAGLLTALAAGPELRDQQRVRRARELLAQAREDYRTQQYLGCLERCELLSTSYADLPEGAEARQLAGEVKDNPELLARACDSLNQRMGVMYLTLAESWMKKGDARQAQLCLERVMQAAPGTRQAEQAQVQLARLQGTSPTQQAEYKKP
jgi:thioredoxin-like negative regulator of GroEL